MGILSSPETKEDQLKREYKQFNGEEKYWWLFVVPVLALLVYVAWWLWTNKT